MSSLFSPLWEKLLYLLGKHCRTWSDTALCGVWSGNALFAHVKHVILSYVEIPNLYPYGTILSCPEFIVKLSHHQYKNQQNISVKGPIKPEKYFWPKLNTYLYIYLTKILVRHVTPPDNIDAIWCNHVAPTNTFMDGHKSPRESPCHYLAKFDSNCFSGYGECATELFSHGKSMEYSIAIVTNQK